MQVSLTVEGVTYQALQDGMDQALASFMTGAPSGTVAVLDQMLPATKVRDKPAGFDSVGGDVLTLPVYSLTHVYQVGPPPE